VARLIIFILFSFFTFTFAQVKIIVKFKTQYSEKVIDNILSKEIYSIDNKIIKKSHLKKIIPFNDYGKIWVSDARVARKILKALKDNSKITTAYIEPILKIDVSGTDSLLSKQWGITAINAPEAWEITEGSKKIIIGLIDTGVKTAHEDLNGQFWVNPKEDINKNGKFDKGDLNGIDDDNNGFIDDVMGWNFTDGNWNNNPTDDNGHGTYVAGIIGAKSHNSIGISGIAPNCKLLNLKAFNSNGYGREEDVVSAIFYAINAGARIINMSFGDKVYSQLFKDALDYAFSQGIILVGSSGNTGNDELHYPSSFDGVISVGAVNKYNAVATFSSYGSTLDLVAPGVSILTTNKEGGYSEISGTSAAAPFVTGAVALLLSVKDDLTPDEVAWILKNTATDIEEPNWDIHSGAGLLNAFAAVTNAIPSVVKFITPQQGKGFNSMPIDVTVSVLHPKFDNFSLYLGIGQNPSSWTKLLESSRQVLNEKILSLQLAPNPVDTLYTLRLLVRTKSGDFTEKRTNFYFDKSPPKIVMNPPIIASVGSAKTLFVELRTDDLTSAYIHFRYKGDKEFKTVSLDDFSSGIRNVKHYHFGMLPFDYFTNSTEYYLSAQNLCGLTTYVGNAGKPFIVGKIQDDFSLLAFREEKTDLDYNDFYPFPIENPYTSRVYYVKKGEGRGTNFSYKFYTRRGANFYAEDSIANIIPLYFGKYGTDSLFFMVGKYQRTGYVLRQTTANKMHFDIVYTDSSGKFYPVKVADLNGDGKEEIICNENDEKYLLYGLDEDAKPYFIKELLTDLNISESISSSKVNNNIQVLKDNGKTNIMILSPEGELTIFDVDKNFNLSKKLSYEFSLPVNFSGALTGYRTSLDGSMKIACLFNSPNPAPYHLLEVFTIKNNTLNLLTEKFFIDKPDASGFFKKDNSKISFVRFSESDTTQYLFLNTGKYFYVYDHNKCVYFDDGSDKLSFFVDTTASMFGTVGNDGKLVLKSFDTTFPETPFDLSGYSLSDGSVYLSWKGSGTSFQIFRSSDSLNFHAIGLTNTCSFVDSSVELKKNYYYFAKAIDSEGNFSVPSNVARVFAHIPAKVTRIQTISSNILTLKFNVRISVKTSEFAPKVKLNGEMRKVEVFADRTDSYTLIFDTNFLKGENSLIYTGFVDFWGALLEDSTNFFYAPDSEKPQNSLIIENYKLITEKEIKLIFNLPLDSTSATDKDNYEITPENSVRKIVYNRDFPNETLLFLQNPVGALGIPYTLHVKNIFSSRESGSIPIVSGAGSYVKLTKEVTSLKNVFVFPNPVILSNTGGIHFANLPRGSEITVFSISGARIITISPEVQNGGYTWNLKDVNGKLISSGVYLYQIIIKDDSGEIKNKILKKFAVIK